MIEEFSWIRILYERTLLSDLESPLFQGWDGEDFGFHEVIRLAGS